MVFVQKWPFWQLFFFSQYGPRKYFLRYSRTKKAFLGYKNRKFKKSKNWHFSKRVNPWFGPKMAIFATFFFDNIGRENVFYDILERKNAFLGYKNKNFKKSNNLHFSKGVTFFHGFCPKIAVLATFFFRQYKPGKCLLRYSRT